MIFKKSSLSGMLKTAVFLLSFAAALQNIIIIGEIHNLSPDPPVDINTMLGQFAKEHKVVFFQEDLPDHWITQETNHKNDLGPEFRPYVHRLEQFITRIFTDALGAMYNYRLKDMGKYRNTCFAIKKSLELQKGYCHFDRTGLVEKLCNLRRDDDLPWKAVNMIWNNSDKSFQDAVNSDLRLNDYFRYATNQSETPGEATIAELSAPMRNQQWVNQIEKIFALNDAKSPEVDIVLVMGMGHVEDFKTRLMKSALYQCGDQKFEMPLVYPLWKVENDNNGNPLLTKNDKAVKKVYSHFKSYTTNNTKSIWKTAFLSNLFSFTY